MESRQPSARARGAATLEKRYNRAARNDRDTPVGFRNDLPPLVPYAWRARAYPRAARIIAAAMTTTRPVVPQLTAAEKERKRAQNQRAWRRRQARLRLAAVPPRQARDRAQEPRLPAVVAGDAVRAVAVE